MTLLGFTKLLPKLLDGTKTQTVRKPRKRPFKVGETVQIYWKLRTKQCRKLGEGIITKIEHECIADMTQQDAVLDGFDTLLELSLALLAMHPDCDKYSFFDIITWKWTQKQSRCDVCPINVDVRRNIRCCETCTKEHPAYKKELV